MREVHRRHNVYVTTLVYGVETAAKRHRVPASTVRRWVRWVEKAIDRIAQEQLPTSEIGL